MHRRVPDPDAPRRLIPALCAVGLAGLLIGATAAVFNLGAVTDTAAISAAAAARDQDRAADRDARPTIAITASRAAKPTGKPRPTQPSSSGAITANGSCQASFYSDGQHTANGEVFDPYAFTAANKTLPFNTRVIVTNKANGKSVVVRINDRGPFVAGRCLDLSLAAFAAIANLSTGVISVNYAILS
jgi:rare lipoprotein A